MTQTDEILALLSWHSSPADQARGLALASRARDLSAFIQPCGERYHKDVWDNCAKVLSARTDAELVPHLSALLRWLQDMNWPSAQRIMDRLRGFADRQALSAALGACLLQAQAANDEEWIENLRMVGPEERI